jgi:AcrR family transcriptional regulator
MGKIRDAERTKARILHAAADAVRSAGPNVSLDAIALEAGVSKGGLMHHFPSRERLMVALVEALYGDFEAEVAAAVPRKDTEPGRLARAYIRVSFASLEPADTANATNLLLAQLLGVPAVRRYLEEGESRFQSALVEDGLHPRIARLIISATQGAEEAEMYERPDTAGLRVLEQDLLALTRVAPAVLTILDVAVTKN